MKKLLKVLLSVMICIISAVGISVGGFFIFYTPSLTADMSVITGPVTNGASGYLYGIAEDGVPSKNICESVDISSVSAKVIDGLQHPIGDVSHVVSRLDGTDYIVVYLQDAYSTWYYENDAIEKSRADGTYNWQDFLKNDYLPKVTDEVKKLSNTEYSDKIVYCLYNECDNGVWFGETAQADWKPYGVLGEFNEQGANNFFEAWKITYDLVRSINPDAIIGGPGYCDFDINELTAFLSYCKEKSCVPDIMIYHELSDYSIRLWQQNVAAYRELEKELAIDALPIIVTEYGRMCDNGLPGNMLKYITQIEGSKVYGDNAYWRLANNLNDTAADNNSPNSNWWLYRWYTDMQGNTVETKYQDLFMSNFENAFVKRKEAYTSWGFMGVVSMTQEQDKIDIICGGRDGSAVVKLKNLNDTAFKNQRVCVKVEEVLYKGLSGVVNTPQLKSLYYTKAGNTLTVDLNDMDASSAYHITIVPVSEELVQEDYTSDRYIKRYEFEDGKLLGKAYTYNNWYAATGSEENDLVGGMENEGDGVSITIDVPEDGNYDLNFIYGNANDGVPDENGKQNPDDRKDAISTLIVDGNECDISFANTIKSEFTDCLTLNYELSKGKHTISVKHKDGTIVLDSLLVTASEDELIAALYDADRAEENADSYLIIAPADGYYNISALKGNYKLNDIPVVFNDDNYNTVYLMRGLNYLDTDNTDGVIVSACEDAGKTFTLTPENAKLFGSAKLTHNDVLNEDYITDISCNDGSAEYTVNATKAGMYAMTIRYANNDEGGFHDYNVDLIERYVTVSVGDRVQDVYCRNTYSWDTYKTVTCYIELNEGSNTITLTNSGKNKFNNLDTFIPNISLITVNEICA